MILLKDNSVSTVGLRPEMMIALMVAERVYSERQANLVVTSGTENHGHSIRSLHYCGCAVDIRTRNVSDPGQVAGEIRDALNIDYDVVLESDHIHIEFQPEGRDR